ncbi:MAG: glycosyltransferase [Calditrichaeota bacterium]|nr:glycosyltransferase [Calditrichota bacterium]
MKRNNALLIFVKAPQSGKVKTRLNPPLREEQILKLYRVMVEELVDQFRNVDFCQVKIFCAPPSAVGQFRDWLGNDMAYYAQQGDDLGEKMHNAIKQILKKGFEKVVLIGSDIPTIDLTTIIRAFSVLENSDVTLGPSLDGGYYLIGMKKPRKVLFENIIWSTDKVLRQTIARIQQNELSLSQIEVKNDIDTYDDLVQLWKFLKKRNIREHYYYRQKLFDFLKTIFEEQFVPTKQLEEQNDD